MRQLTERTGRGFGIGFVAAIVVALLASGFAVVASAPSASAGGAPAPTGDPGSGWIRDVQVTTDPNGDRRPALTTDANGNILVAYESDAAGNLDIMFEMSNDFGRTWSAPVAIANSGAAEVNPSVTTDPFSGRIFATYQLGTVSPTTMMAAYSDDGVMWVTTTAFVCGVFCERPKIVSEYWNGANNRQYIVFAGEVAAGTNWDWAIVRSTDQGATWNFLYESGLGATDVRHQPVIAVQRGTDGTDRVIVFYRYGANLPGTEGYMAWSQDYGATWLGPSFWASVVNSPPQLAASHDGDSVLIAYASNTNDVIWAVDMDPTDLTWGTSTTWSLWGNVGSNVALGVDGDGSTSLTIGGSYHLIYRATADEIHYAAAPTTLTMASDWSAPFAVSDTAVQQVSVTYPEKTVTTVARGGTWYPAVAWSDFRDFLPDYNLYLTTPGNTYTINTTPPGLQVTVDSVTLTAPVVMTWFSGEVHTISAPSPQTAAPGSRYTFSSWSDGGGQSHTVTVGGGDATIVATFLSEFFLTVNSPYPGVSGSGWYAAGNPATLLATSPQAGPTGTRYVFAAWTGDLLSSANPATLTMDAPKAVSANWRTEYELVVGSAHGNVTGAGWYRAGDPATVTVAQREVTEAGRTWQFTGWSGDATGTNSTASVTMSGPKTVTANWREKPGLLSGTTGALILVGILAVVLLLILAFAIMRRRRKPQPTFQQMQPMPALGAPPTTAPPPPPASPEAPPSWPQPPPSGPPP